jgi:hypothetical protein
MRAAVLDPGENAVAVDDRRKRLDNALSVSLIAAAGCDGRRSSGCRRQAPLW